MKKPTDSLWERQERLAAYSEARRSASRRPRRRDQAQRYVPPGELIPAPESFDLLRGGGKQVIKFLRAVARSVLEMGIPVRLDFRRTKKLFPPATILLFAEIDRIVSQSTLPKPVTILDPRLRRTREVFKQIGLYELTRDDCDVVPERRDVVFWKATKGLNQSGEKLQLLEAVTQQVNEESETRLKLEGVWRGVSEAVMNVVDHAYKHPRDDGFAGLQETRWWMFTQFRDSTFTVVVCDLGCGYRSTINSTLPADFILRGEALFRGLHADAVAIETAMAYGRSGTKLAERGKGSRDALSVLEKHRTGELFIASNSAWVKYEYLQGHERKSSNGSLGISIRGTIVWWKLPVKEQ